MWPGTDDLGAGFGTEVGAGATFLFLGLEGLARAGPIQGRARSHSNCGSGSHTGSMEPSASWISTFCSQRRQRAEDASKGIERIAKVGLSQGVPALRLCLNYLPNTRTPFSNKSPPKPGCFLP